MAQSSGSGSRGPTATADGSGPTPEPTEVDPGCTLRGGTLAVGYEDGLVSGLRTGCDGLRTDSPGEPDGLLARFSLEPAGLVDRTPEKIYAAAWARSVQRGTA